MEYQWKRMLTEDHAIVKDQVAPCGIRCGDCDLGNGSVSETATDLMRYVKRYDLPSWAHELPGGSDIDFKQFELNLAWVGKWLKCPGCLRGGGNPECPIRLCAKERDLSNCAQCDDLKVCTKFNWLGEKGESLKDKLADGV
jgi:hypothetical protein